jgi:hypothetical protein
MNNAADMGSVAMIYVPSFVDIGSEIQKLTEGVYTDKACFQNKESRLKRKRRIIYMTFVNDIGHQALSA